MSLFGRLPHTVDVMGPPTTTRDSGGGEIVAWPTTRAASVPTLIQVASASEQERFSQMGLVCTHVCAFSGTASGIERGDKLVWGSVSLRVTGIQTQPGVGNIATFTRVYAEQLL